MTLKIGMQYRVFEYYQAYSNDVYQFYGKVKLVPHAFVWEKANTFFKDYFSLWYKSW